MDWIGPFAGGLVVGVFATLVAVIGLAILAYRKLAGF